MCRKYIWLFVLVLLVACSPQVTIQAPESNGEELQEVPITEIALAGSLAKRESEISSLAWYGDTLILLPQYPDFDGGSHLYALSKSEIETYLASDNPAPLSPRPVPFDDSGLSSLIGGFQGFEAIEFVGDRVYLTIEAELDDGMRGYLVSGQIAPDLSEVVMVAEVVTEIVLQGRHENRTDETMLLYADTLVTLYEVNGVKVNKDPVANRFDFDLKTREPLPFSNIEYRVTDATVVDEKGRFWVINFYDPRDKNLQTDTDPLADRFGLGATHATYNQVERLVEMRITDAGVSLTDTPPLYLELLSKVPRKWEGIVRFNDGFLLATDKFPVTVLAYVGK
jgi:hypothetical protein